MAKKLGKKARKFARKHLQCAAKRNRKLRSQFTRRPRKDQSCANAGDRARVTIFGDVYPLPAEQQELNVIFSKPLREFLSSEGEVDDAALISVDSKGIDIRVRQGAQFNIQRLAFDVPHKVETLEEAKRALHKIIKTSSK